MPDQTPVQRRLAAILAGDVVGYSRLMGLDEVGSLRALKAIRRELADPAIAAHHGRVVKATEDGILIEFPTVVDAVDCAVAIPAACEWAEMARSGCPFGYCPDRVSARRRVAHFIANILRDAGDLPLEQPSYCQLALNLKFADADEVIE